MQQVNSIKTNQQQYSNKPNPPISETNRKPASNPLKESNGGPQMSQTDMVKYLERKVSDLNKITSELKLGLDTNPVRTDLSATSSNPQVVDASLNGSYTSGVTSESMRIGVSSIAQTQLNESDSFTSNALTSAGIGIGLPLGMSVFTLHVGEQQTEVQDTITAPVHINPLTEQKFTLNVNVVAGVTTNRDVMQSMAQQINNTIAPVHNYLKASVVDNAETGTSKLVIESTKAGTAHAFAFERIGVNSPAQKMGLVEPEREASNLEYDINGKEYTGESNTVYLQNNKLKLDFSRSSGGFDITQVKVGKNSSNVESGLKKFAETFNDIQDFTKNLATSFGKELHDKLKSLSLDNKSDLSELGVSVSSSGKLSIDEGTLQENLSTKLQSFFQNFSKGGGFFSKIGSFTDSLSKTFESNSLVSNKESSLIGKNRATSTFDDEDISGRFFSQIK